MSQYKIQSNYGDFFFNSELKLTDINDTLKLETKVHNNQVYYEYHIENQYIFNDLLNNCINSINEVFAFINIGLDTFKKYDISRKVQKRINNYINSLYQYNHIWTNLFSKPDYNLTLYKHRVLPFINSESKEWKKANIDAINDYPKEIFADSTTEPANIFDSDFQAEIKFVNKNNNFQEWSILPIDKYPNLDIYLNQLKVLERLNMQPQIINMACKLLLSPKDCHIVGVSRFWKILRPFMENMNLYKIIEYCTNYAMYILKQEETIMFSQVNLKYRVLFQLEEVYDMPSFSKSHIDHSPYVIQLTNDARTSDCIPFYLRGERKLNDYKEFNYRLNLATGGAFKGIDLAYHGMAITGSILIPCVHQSPLEDLFTDNTWTCQRKKALKYPYMVDEPQEDRKKFMKFMRYLEEYYPSYISLTDSDYTEQVLEESHVNFDYGKTDNLKDSKMVQDHINKQCARRQYMKQIIETKLNEPKEDQEWNVSDDELSIKSADSKLTDDVQPNDAKLNDVKSDDTLNDAVLVNASIDTDEEYDQHNFTDENKNEQIDMYVDYIITGKNDKKKETKKKRTKVNKRKNKRRRHHNKNSSNNDQLHVEVQVDITNLNLNETKVKTITETKIETNTETKDEPKLEDKTKIDIKTIQKIEYNQLADIDVSITTTDPIVFKKRVELLYNAIKFNCQHRGPIYIKEIKTIASTKYKIYGPGLPRPIDVFRIPYDAAKMVKKFHVNAVKMYYDGKISMFRSCITTLLSGVGESYKWFSCNKTPADVLLKYAQRGISIILNSKERVAISNYITDNIRWGKMLKYCGINANQIYTTMNAEHPFFQSGIYGAGIRLGLRKVGTGEQTIHNTTLITPHSNSLTEYGDLKIREVNKWYVPNLALITACLDHVFE